jgi:alkaline phosphatase
MAEAGMEVLLGGGASFFRAEDREDGVDRMAPFRARGCAIVAATDELPAVDGTPPACLVGLFAEEALPEVGARSPSLLDMVEAGLGVLRDDPDGFFLMVEGSQIDWAAHAQDGPRTAAETVDLDGVVRFLLTRLDGRENTVLVVTADHETGGLGLGTGEGEAAFTWRTTRHTADPVPLFASGPGTSPLADTRPIAEVGQLLLGLVRE